MKKLHYSVKLEQGEVIESTRGREPVSFTIGSQQLPQGKEELIRFFRWIVYGLVLGTLYKK